jgi:hypothetical protein
MRVTAHLLPINKEISPIVKSIMTSLVIGITVGLLSGRVFAIGFLSCRQQTDSKRWCG